MAARARAYANRDKDAGEFVDLDRSICPQRNLPSSMLEVDFGAVSPGSCDELAAPGSDIAGPEIGDRPGFAGLALEAAR
jgi:hypothetical protein